MNIDDAGQEGATRNNKRQQHCTTCKNHGQNLRKSKHKCQYEACECLLCQLTRLSRLVMRHQQRLWRHLKEARSLGDAGRVYAAVGAAVAAIAEQGLADSKLQKCDMCRNHGIMKEKRAHKNTCPYQDCPCDLCDLTRKRRDIMRHQQRVRRSQVTSQQRDEAYDYVVRTTAELARMSMGAAPALDALTTVSSVFQAATTATTTTTSSTTTTTTTTTCSSASASSVTTECTSQTLATTTNAGSSTSVAPLREPPPLELLETCPQQAYPPRHMVTAEPGYVRLVDLSLYNDVPSSSLDMRGFHQLDPSPAWRDLKRDRSEGGNRRLRFFRETDVYMSIQGMAGHNSASTMTPATHQEPPFRTPAETTDSSPALTAPSKKTRLTNREDPQPRDSRKFWSRTSMETSVSLGSGDVQHAGYRRMGASASPELRLRSPPPLIPLPQNQPMRPRPVRPPTSLPGMEWDPVTLPNFASSLLHGHTYGGTLPT